MFTGSRQTLMLFLWVFFVGAGLLNLGGTFMYFAGGGALTGWDYVFSLLSAIYLASGLVLVLKLDTILPQYRRQVIRGLWAMFGIETLVGASVILTSLSDPSLAGPGAEALSTAHVLLIGLASTAFSFLIYKIVTDSVSIVSGTAPRKPSPIETALYWSIVLIFFASIVSFVFWDPATGTFNML